MRSRIAVLSLGLMAAVLWVGLILFVNRRYPDSLGQLVFLLLWFAAISLTAIPLVYLANARFLGPAARTRVIGRSMREGLLIGTVTTVLMALQFVRALGLLTGLILALATLLVELIILLRTG